MSRVIPKQVESRKKDRPDWLRIDDVVKSSTETVKKIQKTSKTLRGASQTDEFVVRFVCQDCHSSIFADHDGLIKQANVLKRSGESKDIGCPKCGGTLKVSSKALRKRASVSPDGTSRHRAVSYQVRNVDLRGKETNRYLVPNHSPNSMIDQRVVHRAMHELDKHARKAGMYDNKIRFQRALQRDGDRLNTFRTAEFIIDYIDSAGIRNAVTTQVSLAPNGGVLLPQSFKTSGGREYMFTKEAVEALAEARRFDKPLPNMYQHSIEPHLREEDPTRFRMASKKKEADDQLLVTIEQTDKDKSVDLMVDDSTGEVSLNVFDTSMDELESPGFDDGWGEIDIQIEESIEPVEDFGLIEDIEDSSFDEIDEDIEDSSFDEIDEDIEGSDESPEEIFEEDEEILEDEEPEDLESESAMIDRLVRQSLKDPTQIQPGDRYHNIESGEDMVVKENRGDGVLVEVPNELGGEEPVLVPIETIQDDAIVEVLDDLNQGGFRVASRDEETNVPARSTDKVEVGMTDFPDYTIPIDEAMKLLLEDRPDWSNRGRMFHRDRTRYELEQAGQSTRVKGDPEIKEKVFEPATEEERMSFSKQAMTEEDFIYESTTYGPGMDGFAYQADTYCIMCGEEIIRNIAPEVAPKLSGTDDPDFQNSEVVPVPIFFGESDRVVNCNECGEYLYGSDVDE